MRQKAPSRDNEADATRGSPEPAKATLTLPAREWFSGKTADEVGYIDEVRATLADTAQLTFPALPIELEADLYKRAANVAECRDLHGTPAIFSKVHVGASKGHESSWERLLLFWAEQ
jgi:hypothetical protein